MNALEKKTIEKPLNLFGYYTSILLFLVTAITFGIAIMTPPLSGPFCTEGCFEYPYTGIADRFPRDYLWMFPAMVVILLYLAMAAALHRKAPEEKKIFSLMALSVALISSAVLLSDYFIQVSSIQPGLLEGETDGVAMLSQYNPHGIFIALEELGYLSMGLSFIFMAPVFAGTGRLETWIRGVLVAGFILIVGALIWISFTFGINREYRFEVAAISIDWLTLIIAGILLSRYFKRSLKSNLNIRL